MQAFAKYKILKMDTITAFSLVYINGVVHHQLFVFCSLASQKIVLDFLICRAV